MRSPTDPQTLCTQPAPALRSHIVSCIEPRRKIRDDMASEHQKNAASRQIVQRNGHTWLPSATASTELPHPSRDPRKKVEAFGYHSLKPDAGRSKGFLEIIKRKIPAGWAFELPTFENSEDECLDRKCQRFCRSYEQRLPEKSRWQESKQGPRSQLGSSTEGTSRKNWSEREHLGISGRQQLQS